MIVLLYMGTLLVFIIIIDIKSAGRKQWAMTDMTEGDIYGIS